MNKLIICIIIFILIDNSFESYYYFEVNGKKFEFVLEDEENGNAKTIEEKFPMTDISFEKKDDACFISKDPLTEAKGYSSRLGLVKGNILLFGGKIVLSYITNKNYEFQSYLVGKVVE